MLFPKTVLFDLDGTLLNTLGDLADAINYAMRSLGRPEKNDAEVLAAIGNGVRRAIISVLSTVSHATDTAPPGTPPVGAASCRPPSVTVPAPALVDEALALFRSRYEQCYMNRTAPYPGVVDIMRELRASGYKIGVISNKTDAFTSGLINKHFFGLVDASAGELPGVPLKPAPDAVYNILTQIGGVSNRTVYVGDSDVDFATARNAGIPCILVSWGFRSRDTLVAAGAPPSSIVDTAAEVLAHIKSILPFSI